MMRCFGESCRLDLICSFEFLRVCIFAREKFVATKYYFVLVVCNVPCCFLFVAVRCAPWWFTQKGCGLMFVALVIPDVCTCEKF